MTDVTIKGCMSVWHTQIRPEMSRGISKHQQQAVISKERMVWERVLTVKLCERRTGHDAQMLPCGVTVVATQGDDLSMAARGSAGRQRERRMRSMWRHEQAFVRMAGSYRKATGIEVGVQAGTPLCHHFDLESDPDDTIKKMHLVPQEREHQHTGASASTHW